jgi:P27 family predicted phage terminase small subunit
VPGPRQPTNLIVAKGAKHLTRAEEDARRDQEVVVPVPDKATPPKWLPKALRKDFCKLGGQLLSVGLYSDLDADNLGRYLVAHQQWLQATAQAAVYLQSCDAENADVWGKLQDRYFKQARACANDMGLSVTSRCRIVVPQVLVNAAAAPSGDGTDDFTRMLRARQEAALMKAE